MRMITKKSNGWYFIKKFNSKQKKVLKQGSIAINLNTLDEHEATVKAYPLKQKVKEAENYFNRFGNELLYQTSIENIKNYYKTQGEAEYLQWVKDNTPSKVEIDWDELDISNSPFLEIHKEHLENQSDLPPLSEVINQYKKYKFNGHGWNNKTPIQTYELGYEILLETIGDKPINNITPNDLETYVDALQHWPLNSNTHNPWKTMSVKEILDVEDIADDKLIAPTSANRHLIRAKDVLKYAKKRYSINIDFIDLITIKAETVPYRSFTKKEMKMIFNSMPVDISHWVKIAAYHGFRLNEIQQAKIKYDDEANISYFELDENADIKNKHSQRIIPVHSKCLDIIKDFPFSENAGTISRKFSDLITSLGIKKSRRENFHSLRKTCSENIKSASIPVLARILGHEVEGGGTTYGVYRMQEPLEDLNSAIQSIKY